MLIQDTSEEAAWGAGWGSRGASTADSTSLRFEEVVCTSVAMMGGLPVDGGLCFTGREKPDGVGSEE